MNDVVIGRSLRALRTRLSMRQVDVARKAHVSQQLVSKIECGRLACVSMATLRRVLAAVNADVVTLVRWRGGEVATWTASSMMVTRRRSAGSQRCSGATTSRCAARRRSGVTNSGWPRHASAGCSSWPTIGRIAGVSSGWARSSTRPILSAVARSGTGWRRLPGEWTA
jgi:DNA-binding XRE family transcriptional regulator